MHAAPARLRSAANDFRLGTVQFVQVEAAVFVANLIGQRDVRASSERPPNRYEAVAEGLRAVARFAKEKSASVHMPRIGCGLAGGRWEVMGPIIERDLEGLMVRVYDLA